MRRIATVAVAVALLGSAGAATAGAEQAGTQGCTTWQYKIKYMTPLMDMYGNRTNWAYKGNKFNTIEPLDDRYYGTLYRADNTRRDEGWLHKAALDYTNCW